MPAIVLKNAVAASLFALVAAVTADHEYDGFKVYKVLVRDAADQEVLKALQHQ